MAEIPDQFLFINKTAKSGSLSHSKAREKSSIYSHVHGKYHKEKRTPKVRTFVEPIVSTSALRELAASSALTKNVAPDTADSSSHVPNSSREWEESRQHKHPPSAIQSSHAQLSGSAVDPFFCSSITIDAQTQNLLYYPFKDFIEKTFSAESLSDFNKPSVFRHRRAVTTRLQKCVVDDLTMYTTLAYCASCMKWTIGEDERQRPTEFYILKAIEVLRLRLTKAETVDCWVLLSIYALAISEMWAHHYEAATAHLKMIRHFVAKVGGVKHLESYLMESILLCDKYVAVGKFEPPILPLDWEPAPLPRLKMLEIQVQVGPLLGTMAQGFSGPVEDFLGHGLMQILADIVICIQVAEFIKIKPTADTTYQRWLFLRHQALVSRLLSLTPHRQIQESTRIALIVWLSKITAHFGPQRWFQRLLPRLKAAILHLDGNDEWYHSSLLFWMTCLGAMTAEDTDNREWFVARTVKIARSLNIKAEKDHYRQELQKYLFLTSEDGSRFSVMVRASREMDEGAEHDCFRRA